MALGRVIREHRLYTYVGQRNPASDVETLPGYCYSACALAFLGGEYRYLINGSTYGVHRFFWKEHTNADADVAQIISAAVVQYINEMGVCTKLFALASQAGPSEIVTPSPDELSNLDVVNNGRKPVQWSIESIPGAIYLKGQQETSIGMNKFMLTCPAKGALYLYAIFDAGQNTNDVMRWPTNWLFIDGQHIEIEDQLFKKAVANGWINLYYHADKGILSAIANAKDRVGVGLAPTPGAAVFNGFADMPFKDGAMKLPGFLQVCGRR